MDTRDKFFLKLGERIFVKYQVEKEPGAGVRSGSLGWLTA